MPFRTEFDEQLLNFVDTGTRILDVGGGIYPLMFPWEELRPSEYILVEKDKKAVDAVQAFKEVEGIDQLKIIQQNIEDIKFESLGFTKRNRVDVAFMFKFVSVAARRDRKVLHRLAEIPARRFIITGPKEALVRKENIRNRENKSLMQFIGMTGGKIVDKINIENEFGYVVDMI